jgi:hypothetical protein
MATAWQALKEKFQNQERCDKPSCTEGVGARSSKVVYPPDRSQIGRANWKYVHSRAAYFPEIPSAVERQRELAWIHSFIYTYPCGICARDFTAICSRIPPALSSRKEYEDWWVVVHNEVNKDLSKPVFQKIA